MKAEFDKVGFPIMPLVHQLAKACDPESARWVHWGSTTQDIIDTGLVLQMRDGIALLEQDLEALINTLAALAAKHRNTVMAGRTFQQQAAPITFGYKAAVWLDEMLRHQERLNELKKRVLVGQCAGAVGTLATLGQDGIAVQRAMMEELAWLHRLSHGIRHVTAGQKWSTGWCWSPVRWARWLQRLQP